MRSAAFFRFWADKGERFRPRRKLGFVDQAIGNRQSVIGDEGWDGQLVGAPTEPSPLGGKVASGVSRKPDDG